MSIATRIVILGASAVCASVSVGRADEAKVDVASAPQAVQAAVKKIVGSSAITGFSKEIEDGKTSYEVEYKLNDAEHSATFAPDGKVLEQEEPVKAANLPAAVTAAIAKAAPGGKVGEVSKVKADDKSYYEADVTVGEEKHEIKLAADGTVLSNKIEKDDDEKDEKDEHKEPAKGTK